MPTLQSGRSALDCKSSVTDFGGSSPSGGTMEGVRMDEGLVLKTSGCKRFGGSIPFSSAIHE